MSKATDILDNYEALQFDAKQMAQAVKNMRDRKMSDNYIKQTLALDSKQWAEIMKHL